jgi:hypothetical protein
MNGHGSVNGSSSRIEASSSASSSQSPPLAPDDDHDVNENGLDISEYSFNSHSC